MLAAAPALAGVQVSTTGSSATATIDLAPVHADLSLSFSDPAGLAPETLGIDATLLNLLALDPLLVSRLGNLGTGAINSAFPLLIEIEPADALAFSDTVMVEVHTHNLEYAPGTRLRLFKSTGGGAFEDITIGVEPGSVRTRGRTGGFSEFLVLTDLRPTSSVVQEKLGRVESRLADANGLSPAERSALEAKLADAEAAFLAGQPAAAITALDEFDLSVRQLSGSAIPNRWSAAGGLDNVAGDLQAGVATLRFSLGYLRDFGD